MVRLHNIGPMYCMAIFPAWSRFLRLWSVGDRVLRCAALAVFDMKPHVMPWWSLTYAVLGKTYSCHKQFIDPYTPDFLTWISKIGIFERNKKNPFSKSSFLNIFEYFVGFPGRNWCTLQETNISSHHGKRKIIDSQVPAGMGYVIVPRRV